MSDLLRSLSIPSLSTRSAFSRRRFVTLQLTDVSLPGSSSVPPLSIGTSTATSLSAGPLSVGSLPVELPLPSIEIPSIDLSSIELSSIELPSVGPLSVGSLPIELPLPSIDHSSVDLSSVDLPSIELPSIDLSSIELSSIELSSIELPSVEPSSKIPTSDRFPFAESSLTTSSSLEPRLLEPRSFGTRLHGYPIAGPDYQVSNGSNPEVYHIDVKTFPSTSPCTVYNLPALGYDASDILAVIGKVQGMGKFDSDTCHHYAKIWEMCTTPSTLKIFSEGTEGVLGTHVTLVLKSKEPTGLCAVIGRTQDFLLGELGTSDHALIVSSYVSTMANKLNDFTGCLEDSENDVQCNMVFIKCPRGCNSEESRRSRYACAFGVCHGLHEVPSHGLQGDLPKIRAEINMGYWRTWSEKAYCVPSIEREDCGLLMIATNSRTTGNLRAISTVMTHPIDVNPIQEALKKIKDDGGNLIQVFATVNPNKRGAGGVQFSNEQINSAFHSMNNDPNMSGDQHVRAAVGGQLAALCGNTNIYVSGGGDGQGPWGGGNLCFIYKIDSQINEVPVDWMDLDIEFDLNEAEMNALALSEGNSGLNVMAIPGVNDQDIMVIPRVNDDQNTMAIPQVNSGLNIMAMPEVDSGLNTMVIPGVIDQDTMVIPQVYSGLDTMAIPRVYNGLDTMTMSEVNDELNSIAIPQVNNSLNFTTISELNTEPKRKRSRLE
ncbi:uncharacterized protein EAE98_011440 [Botrytis deweyae]|uniref:Uncharacterized protein n=1 Tax=Botrytis deweyae TaxID=2478750 RepID=A0ABQ7I5X8_9HELO|nr:uncharacterized protein EAE98_011440 [Botrytis deweyae]KAF7914741.1 hypothetical protein EAE98_011440 [Botrytis deweyae]